jgi:DcuC family C4-dicarboxylate transporter
MAIVPFVPLTILMLGSTKIVPAFNVPTAYAMFIGAIAGVFASFSNRDHRPSKAYIEDITKNFFDGMGKAYGGVIGVIIAAAVFAQGLQAIGLIKALTETMIGAELIAKIASVFGPSLLAIIVGSGDAATIAFNESVTPHAATFGMEILQMGGLAHVGGVFGRTMSPLAPAAIICAGYAGTDPMDIMKRNGPGMIIAMFAAIFILA